VPTAKIVLAGVHWFVAKPETTSATDPWRVLAGTKIVGTATAVVAGGKIVSSGVSGIVCSVRRIVLENKSSRTAPAHARREIAQAPETQAKAVQTGNVNAVFI
jgi:hypothetical protein